MTPLVLLMCTLHIPINRNKEPRYSCIFTGIHLILINSRLQITISMCDAPFISHDQLGCFLCQIKQCSLVDLCLSSHCISTRKWSDIVKKVVVNHRSDTLVYRQFFFPSKGSVPTGDGGTNVTLKSPYPSCGIPANFTATSTLNPLNIS